MVTEEQKKQIREFLLNNNVATILSSAKNAEEFANFYHSIIGEDSGCTGCPNEVRAALNKLELYSLNKYQPQKTSIMNYQLKKGAQVYCASLGIVLTEKNMTDNNARFLLSENKKAATLFEVLPENWEEDIKKKPERKKQPETTGEKDQKSKAGADQKPSGKGKKKGGAEGDGDGGDQGDQGANGADGGANGAGQA